MKAAIALGLVSLLVAVSGSASALPDVAAESGGAGHVLDCIVPGAACDCDGISVVIDPVVVWEIVCSINAQTGIHG